MQGSYQQKVGLATELGLSHPPAKPKIVIQDAADPKTNTYAFNNPLIWHEVMPCDQQPVSSIAVGYTPSDWGQAAYIAPNPTDIRRLSKDENSFMMTQFKKLAL